MKKFHIFTLLAGIFAVLIFQSCGSSGSGIDTNDPDKAFAIAKSKFDKGDYLDAIDGFSFIRKQFPQSLISDSVQFYLAESYFKQGEYYLAKFEYTNLMNSFGSSPFVPEAWYKLGVCYYNMSPKPSLDQEYTVSAKELLSDYIDKFPGDKNIADANLKLQDLKNKLAYKDYSTAIIYMKMEHYRAAALYFENVYDKYIESDWGAEAMLGHAEALIDAKKYDDAKKVLNDFDTHLSVFEKRFPKSNLKSRENSLKNSIPSK